MGGGAKAVGAEIAGKAGRKRKAGAVDAGMGGASSKGQMGNCQREDIMGAGSRLSIGGGGK